MLFTTTTEWIALALVFIGGWLLGLASHPGGRRWKTRYADEREAHARLRQDHDARLTEAQRRVTELERDNARLAQATPVTTSALVASAPVARTPARPALARPPLTGERRGWFDWNTRRV